MQIVIRTHRVIRNPELEERLERGIEHAVDRHRSRIVQVSVYLADLNGPKGGHDKLCHMSAELRGARPVLILERGADLGAVIARAAQRLGYRIGRAVDRQRKPASPRLSIRTSAATTQ